MTSISVNLFQRKGYLRKDLRRYSPDASAVMKWEGCAVSPTQNSPDPNLPDGGGHGVPIRSLFVGNFAVGDVRRRARYRQADTEFLHEFTLAGNQGIEPRFDETGSITVADPLERIRRKSVCRKQFHERVVVQFPHSQKRLTDLTRIEEHSVGGTAEQLPANFRAGRNVPHCANSVIGKQLPRIKHTRSVHRTRAK